jgi:hypothetical protein
MMVDVVLQVCICLLFVIAHQQTQTFLYSPQVGAYFTDTYLIVIDIHFSS